MCKENYLSVSVLVGKKILDIKYDKEYIVFDTNEGQYTMHHHQDCCENVYVEDIDGNLSALIGETVLAAYESTNSEDAPPSYEESFLWTFYGIRTNKDSVTIRWLGTSNGYYSEEVDFCRTA